MPLGGLLQGVGEFLGFGGRRESIDPTTADIEGRREREEELKGFREGLAGQAFDPFGGTQIGQFGEAGRGEEFRGGQQALVSQLQQQAAGQGPSIADIAARQAAERGIAGAQALAASARPGQGAAALRQAQQQQGLITGGIAGEAAQARVQEQLGAQRALAGVLSGARGQDVQAAQFNVAQQNQRLLEQARLLQQAGLQGDATRLQQQAMQNQNFLNALNLSLQQARAQQQGELGLQQLLAQTPTAGEELLGGVIGIGGMLAGAG